MKSEPFATIAAVAFPEPSPAVSDQGASGPPASIIDDVPVTLEAVLGSTELQVKDLLALRAGSQLGLSTALTSPIEVRLNQKVVAYAEIVAIDANFGLRITSVVN
ncbi:MAG: hypothetical protein ABS43_17725 [Bordetella sp. SCN 67-23]|nr:FliM/FliN family flagellar motor switch protein [Burkholderiales bacterium]ODS72355.1 MAG: hypothetical protein ABS43_17725 [Bordetella sp. SCN 67-23]OJW86865.1 MAG: hypothetical protein BGO71_26385 [Burkholderiales bacterium 67-32]